jgi:hypothetical protein
VTEDGDLVHLFPHGFEKPWEKREKLGRALEAAGRALAGAGRFIVRAWLLVVMSLYAVVFVALLLGLTFARQGSSDRDEGPGLSLVGGLFRMLADALFWTIHPFSPLYLDPVLARDEAWHRRSRGDDVPFYEKVNRFVFGPTVAKEDPHAARARILSEIRAQRGRIALADVMRVTGLPREEADPLMARLMLDHDGDVDVSEGGGIIYRFEALRRSASATPEKRPGPAWEHPPVLPPLTGNPTGSNVMVALLNLFNLLASAWVLSEGLTLGNISLLFQRHPPLYLPDDGTPIVLGLVPFLFSVVIFVLPVVRALFRKRAEQKQVAERARLAVLREVLSHSARRTPVPDEALRTAVRVATGSEPSSQEITRRVVELGGDVDIGPEGEVRYRFAEIEADEEAVRDERARAPLREVQLGAEVFASDR